MSDDEERTVRTTTMKRKVGECPACSAYLWAEVVVETKVGDPYWSDQERRPNENASTYVMAMQVAHHCDSREEPDQQPGTEHGPPERGLPSVATVDVMLRQLTLDRKTAYWGSPPHSLSLDGAESWLLSLRDWLGGDTP